jgi:hypothetical protein
MNVEHDFKNVTADDLSQSILKQAPTNAGSTDPEKGIEHRLYHLGKDIYAYSQTPTEKQQRDEEIINVGKVSAAVPWPGIDKIRQKYQELYSDSEDVKKADNIDWDEVTTFEPMLEIYCTNMPSRLNQIYFNSQTIYVNAEGLGIYGDELEKHPTDNETKKALWNTICKLVDSEQPKHLESPHFPVELAFEPVFEWELRAGLLVEFGAFKWASETAKTVALREKGLKQTEIAEVLDIDQSTVSKNLTRAKNILARVYWTLENKPKIE